MIQDLYYSYRISNSYLEEKYHIHDLNLDDVMNSNIKQTLTRMKVDNTNGHNLLPYDKMDNFIIKMLSSLDARTRTINLILPVAFAFTIPCETTAKPVNTIEMMTNIIIIE